jgi:hypothetical protein
MYAFVTAGRGSRHSDITLSLGRRPTDELVEP